MNPKALSADQKLINKRDRRRRKTAARVAWARQNIVAKMIAGGAGAPVVAQSMSPKAAFDLAFGPLDRASRTARRIMREALTASAAEIIPAKARARSVHD